MKKIGIAIGSFQRLYGDRRALEIAAQIGADCADLDIQLCGSMANDYRNPDSLYGKGEDAVVEYYTELRRYAESLGITVWQTHGRIKGFINQKEEDDALVENGRLDLLASSVLGAKNCVMHTTTSIYMGANPDRELMQSLNFDQFTRLLPYAAQYGITLATETFGDAVRYNSVDFFGDINEFVEGFERVKTASPYGDFFGICMDTGHTNKAKRFGNPTAGDAIRMLGGNITCLHLNDNDTLVDQHKTPMTGTIDWEDTMSALEEVGYEGVYNMELRLEHFGKGFEKETAEFAVKVMRFMLEQRK